MLSLKDKVLIILEKEAEQRGISVQELLRVEVIPQWIKGNHLG